MSLVPLCFFNELYTLLLRMLLAAPVSTTASTILSSIFIFILALLSYGKVEHLIVAIYSLDFFSFRALVGLEVELLLSSFPLGGAIFGCPPVPFLPVHFLGHPLVDIPMNSGLSHYK